MDRVTQCKLVCGNTETTTWIASKHAHVGKQVRLAGDGRWWDVVATYSTADRKSVQNQQHNSGDIWKATSGSMPVGHK